MPYSDTVRIEGFTPTVGTTPLADKLKRDHFVLDQVDWFWRNFVGDGKGLYDALIQPITGDYNRIAENGEAWQHVSTQFQILSKNLTDNTATLLSEHWTQGDASAAYHEYIEINWVGALFISETISEYLAKGFAKISEWSTKLAEKALDLIDRIVKRIIKLAGKAVPVLGQVAGFVEWVASGFKDFPYWSDVADINRMIEQVYSIHESIEKLAETIKDYLNATESILEAISDIPEINSTQDVLQITKTMQRGRKEMEEKRKRLHKQTAELEGKLGDLDKEMNPPNSQIE